MKSKRKIRKSRIYWGLFFWIRKAFIKLSRRWVANPWGKERSLPTGGKVFILWILGKISPVRS